MSLQEVIRLQDPKSLFVVTTKGNLRHLFMPIRMKCIVPAGHIPVGAIVYAEAAFVHQKHLLIYWVGGRLYPYFHFRIDIDY